MSVPFEDFHKADIDFDLDDLEQLTSGQLALVPFHGLATKDHRMLAELLFLRRRNAWKEQEQIREAQERKKLAQQQKARPIASPPSAPSVESITPDHAVESKPAIPEPTTLPPMTSAPPAQPMSAPVRENLSSDTLPIPEKEPARAPEPASETIPRTQAAQSTTTSSESGVTTTAKDSPPSTSEVSPISETVGHKRSRPASFAEHSTQPTKRAVSRPTVADLPAVKYTFDDSDPVPSFIMRDFFIIHINNVPVGTPKLEFFKFLAPDELPEPVFIVSNKNLDPASAYKQMYAGYETSEDRDRVKTSKDNKTLGPDNGRTLVISNVPQSSAPEILWKNIKARFRAKYEKLATDGDRVREGQRSVTGAQANGGKEEYAGSSNTDVRAQYRGRSRDATARIRPPAQRNGSSTYPSPAPQPSFERESWPPASGRPANAPLTSQALSQQNESPSVRRSPSLTRHSLSPEITGNSRVIRISGTSAQGQGVTPTDRRLSSDLLDRIEEDIPSSTHSNLTNRIGPRQSPPPRKPSAMRQRSPDRLPQSSRNVPSRSLLDRVDQRWDSYRPNHAKPAPLANRIGDRRD
jgi:hypothetical protein